MATSHLQKVLRTAMSMLVTEVDAPQIAHAFHQVSSSKHAALRQAASIDAMGILSPMVANVWVAIV